MSIVEINVDEFDEFDRSDESGEFDEFDESGEFDEFDESDEPDEFDEFYESNELGESDDSGEKQQIISEFMEADMRIHELSITLQEHPDIKFEGWLAW
ncbi:24301_t:CDS:2 [Cetraspora pellucida]|uniref:24301_t:CDS:1 n=1 Tax=Cetraspora pellucida TaxID=1433469 RepID=A0A9N9FQ30_9GLOM|nr:24301_t:CDS:2 [Cetraspora pellucida]